MTAKTVPVETFDLVIFGGTGDLALRKLLPGLFRRYADGQIPEDSRIIGVARDKQSDDEMCIRDSQLLEHFVPIISIERAGQDQRAQHAFAHQGCDSSPLLHRYHGYAQINQQLHHFHGGTDWLHCHYCYLITTQQRRGNGALQYLQRIFATAHTLQRHADPKLLPAHAPRHQLNRSMQLPQHLLADGQAQAATLSLIHI